MKQKSLANLLTERPDNSIVWISPLGARSAGELRGRQPLWSDLCKNRDVILEIKSKPRLAEALIVLDGLAREIVLLPPDLDSNTRSRIFQDMKGAAHITDEHSLFTLPSSKNGAGPFDVDTRWSLMTSGTTGTPKKISHTRESLLRTVKVQISVEPNFIWGLLYDLHRFAGLQVFLQSVAGGGRLLIPATLEPLDEALEFLLCHGVTALSATPTLWRKILMRPLSDKFKLKQITLGGEISDGKILSALAARFPAARIVHIYASTEAGVGFSVTDGQAGFPAEWLNQGPRGIKLNTDANGILTVDTGSGAISTGDRVEVKDGRVYFLGRDSGAINVGGNKVHPEEVETVLLEVDGVRAARVSAKKSAITGALVQAEVVAEPPDEKAFVASLESHCRSRLSPFKVPALIRVVKDLKTNSMGKITRDT